MFLPFVRQLSLRSRLHFRVRTSSFLNVTRQEYSTQPHDLQALLRAKIRFQGPISVADYMKEVLTNPTAGYYMDKDVFGTQGDFITSPEISQMFGELLGIWCINEWQQAGSPSHMQIVELGPGRGTLASDILRVFGQFPQLKDVVSVHFVEVSPKLSQLQREKLVNSQERPRGLDTEVSEVDVGQVPYMRATTKSGIEISWYRQLKDVPRGFSCFLAHEFLDALPIYKFQKTEHGWREVLVGVDERTEELALMLAPGHTPASKTLLPDMTSDYRDHVEVSAESGIIVGELSERIGQDGGMALIADYGHDGDKGDTFRAFRRHQLHDPLVEPGTADLTADVDFSYLKRNLNEQVTYYGPVTQADFLQNMGIGVRLKMLYEKSTPEQRKDLISAYDMLTSPNKMGERFKFFSVLPASTANKGYVPAGFVPHSEK